MDTVNVDTIELPCGVIDDQGNVHKTVVLSKMTGRDRKAIAEQDVVRNGGKIITTLLLNTVQEIGSIDLSSPKKKREVLLDMLTADRTFLCLALRKISFGNEVLFQATCGSCGEKNEAKHRIDDLSATQMPPNRVEGKHFIVPIDIDGIKAEARLPNGGDEEAISHFIRSNPIEAQHRTLARCLKSWNGETAIGPGFIDDLDLKTLDEFINQWNKMQPGLDMSYDIDCWSCRTQISLNMQALDFLFPSLRTRN